MMATRAHHRFHRFEAEVETELEVESINRLGVKDDFCEKFPEFRTNRLEEKRRLYFPSGQNRRRFIIGGDANEKQDDFGAMLLRCGKVEIRHIVIMQKDPAKEVDAIVAIVPSILVRACS
jgi:hypothetical protein